MTAMTGFVVGLALIFLVLLTLVLGLSRRPTQTWARDALSSKEQELIALERKCAESLEKLETKTRIASEYFKVIEGIERERNEWKKLYYAEATMHGNAQQLMMSTISGLTKRLEAVTQKPVALPEVLETVRSEYVAAHPTQKPPEPAPGAPA